MKILIDNVYSYMYDEYTLYINLNTMIEVKLPKSVIQLYLGEELRQKLTEGMSRRGHGKVGAYLRELVNEDYRTAKEIMDDDSTQKHAEPMTPEESSEIALEQDLANAEFRSAQAQETDLDSVII